MAPSATSRPLKRCVSVDEKSLSMRNLATTMKPSDVATNAIVRRPVVSRVTIPTTHIISKCNSTCKTGNCDTGSGANSVRAMPVSPTLEGKANTANFSVAVGKIIAAAETIATNQDNIGSVALPSFPVCRERLETRLAPVRRIVDEKKIGGGSAVDGPAIWTAGAAVRESETRCSSDVCREEIEHARDAARRILSDPMLHRRVLVSMAMGREAPRKPHAVTGGRAPSKVLGEGFYWKDYPALENVLRSFMGDYYEMSESCPISKKQQHFNNRLVTVVMFTANHYGIRFDPRTFGSASKFQYKKLRDRVRCYYKAHVQNAKKRLTTVLKNPAKPKNRKVLNEALQRLSSVVAAGCDEAMKAATVPASADVASLAAIPCSQPSTAKMMTVLISSGPFAIGSNLGESGADDAHMHAASLSSFIKNDSIRVDQALAKRAPPSSPFKHREHAYAILQSMKGRKIF